MDQDHPARPLYASAYFHLAAVVVSVVAACVAGLGFSVLIDMPEASMLADLIADRVVAGFAVVDRCMDGCMEVLNVASLRRRD